MQKRVCSETEGDVVEDLVVGVGVDSWFYRCFVELLYCRFVVLFRGVVGEEVGHTG